jgi:hypothetical protein
MSTVPQTAASLDDLHRLEGKAELIAGRIVYLMPTGFRPDEARLMLFRLDMARRHSRDSSRAKFGEDATSLPST